MDMCKIWTASEYRLQGDSLNNIGENSEEILRDVFDIQVEYFPCRYPIVFDVCC